jgi:hypothetical protein
MYAACAETISAPAEPSRYGWRFSPSIVARFAADFQFRRFGARRSGTKPGIPAKERAEPSASRTYLRASCSA